MGGHGLASLDFEPIWPWQERQGFPWPSVRRFRGPEPLVLDSGEVLVDWGLAYEEWGPPTGEPVVLFHALTGDSHAARHGLEEPAGWWEGVLGPGLGLDTNRFHVVCFNVLGGSMGSTGPASRAPDGRPWGSRFPRLTLFDMARAVRPLIAAWHQGPVRLVGGSMGGMVALAYASLYPAAVSAVMAIGAPLEHSPWAIAYHTVGQQAVRTDPNFHGGDYYGLAYPDRGLAVARMADMISYQHPQSMQGKFGRGLQEPGRDQFQITSYLRYQGEKLVTRFDANTYLALTEAMDAFSLSSAACRALRPVLVRMVGIESDMLYLPAEMTAHYERLVDAGVSVRLDWLSGPWGHDTFLVEKEAMGRLVTQFLEDTAL